MARFGSGSNIYRSVHLYAPIDCPSRKGKHLFCTLCSWELVAQVIYKLFSSDSSGLCTMCNHHESHFLEASPVLNERASLQVVKETPVDKEANYSSLK